jgi:RimJ/RimL family protein N-acetyltransferase
VTARPLMRSTAIRLAEYRNECRESLRTPGWCTWEGQEEWFKTINKTDSKMWYWEFDLDEYHPTDPDQNGLLGVGGLTFDRFNRSAEISVLTFVRKKGYGLQIVDWLREEAFERQNMHKVWAEVYGCNPNHDAWRSLLRFTDGNVIETYRTDQKYWNGQYWDATLYDVINPREDV